MIADNLIPVAMSLGALTGAAVTLVGIAVGKRAGRREMFWSVVEQLRHMGRGDVVDDMRRDAERQVRERDGQRD